MTQLKNWIAKRSGSAITVHGINVATEAEVIVTGVSSITADEGDKILAHTEKGVFELVLAEHPFHSELRTAMEAPMSP